MSQDKLSLLHDTSSNLPLAQENNVVNYEAVDDQAQGYGDSFAAATLDFTPRKLPQYVAALSATMSALATGAVLGWTSPILNDIENGTFHNITVNNDQMGWIGSFVTLGAMLMCIPTGFICDMIGRKTTLLLLIVPFSVGWTLVIVSRSILMLYLGRFVLGMAGGACCVAAPLYTSEISRKEIRGTLGSYFQLMVTVGIFLAYLSGKFLTPMNYTFFCTSLPVVFVILFACQPETPTFYLKRGLYDKALLSLKRLRGENCNNETELLEIEGTLKESLETSMSLRQTLRKKSIVKAVTIALALMFFQQFSGINAVILYTSDIFTSAGVKLDPKTASIIVGAFQAVATFLSSLVVDKLGRKILLLASLSVMALSSMTLALFFSLKLRTHMDADLLKEIGIIPVVSLCIFVVMFSVGIGPIPWMMSGEIFPQKMKSIAGSTAGTLNWFLAFLITKFYLQVNVCVGQDSTFYFFSCCSLFGALFVYFVVPETKGKTIEEIQTELDN